MQVLHINSTNNNRIIQHFFPFLFVVECRSTHHSIGVLFPGTKYQNERIEYIYLYVFTCIDSSLLGVKSKNGNK